MLTASAGAVGTSLTLLGAYWLLTCVHELFHLMAACVAGHAGGALTTDNLWSATCSKHVCVRGANGWHAAVIRHSGWVGSLLLAGGLSCTCAVSFAWQAAAWLVAVDSMCSDLFGKHAGAKDAHQNCRHVTSSMLRVAHAMRADDIFHCGNFGLLLLSREKSLRNKVVSVLKEMVRVTMMRGAQSGGVVTYVKNGKKGVKGVRSRVVNGKRTDLSELVANKLSSDQKFCQLLDGPRLYAGHTRFATTSKATFDGTHPHQWTPREDMMIWRRSVEGVWTPKTLSVENYICHNGDLDSFDVAKVTYPLELLMPWLARVNHAPIPSPVDSCGVAGLIDILRCQGCWYKAVKFGFIFGVNRLTLDYDVPTKEEFKKAADAFDAAFREAMKEDYEPRTGMSTAEAKALFKVSVSRFLCNVSERDPIVLGLLKRCAAPGLPRPRNHLQQRRPQVLPEKVWKKHGQGGRIQEGLQRGAGL